MKMKNNILYDNHPLQRSNRDSLQFHIISVLYKQYKRNIMISNINSILGDKMKTIFDFNGTTTTIIMLLFFIMSGCGGGGGSNNDNIISTVNSGNESTGSNSAIIESLTLTWDAPTTNVDGSELTDLAGYRVYYGTSSNNYTESIDVGSANMAVISNLSSSALCFVVTAYDISGNESDYSNEVCYKI